MAERVQIDLELMLTELEQIQRVGLLTGEETKLVIKKRKRFEYKCQKQTKVKEDFLAYIQYESTLLDLIEMRRDKIGYLHKKNEIDGTIGKRINQLFRILEHRFGSQDNKIWISHLAFLQRMNWKAEAGKVLRRFLQTCSHQEQVWIFASRFHWPSDEIGLSRTLLLEGLRFHPDSMILYREYFMLELDFLKAVQADPDKFQDYAEQKEDILNGKLLTSIFTNALKVIKEPLFFMELLNLVQKSGIKSLVQDLKNDFLDKFHCKKMAYLNLAAATLVPSEDRNKAEKVDECSKVLLEALNIVQSEDFLRQSLNMIQDIAESDSELTEKCEQVAFSLLKSGHSLHLLDENQLEVLEKYQ